MAACAPHKLKGTPVDMCNKREKQKRKYVYPVNRYTKFMNNSDFFCQIVL